MGDRIRREGPAPAGDGPFVALIEFAAAGDVIHARIGLDDGTSLATSLREPEARRLAMDLLRACDQSRSCHGPTYTCPRCHMTSHNVDDARNRYCGNCHRFEDSLI